MESGVIETFAVTGVLPPAPVAVPTVVAEELEAEPAELVEEPEPEVRFLPAEEPAPATEVFPLE